MVPAGGARCETFRYDAADPFAVRLDIRYGSQSWVRWQFARDLDILGQPTDQAEPTPTGLCLSPWRRSPNIYLGDTMTIASCKIKPEGGPLLGRFTLQRTEQKVVHLWTRNGGMSSAHNGAKPTRIT